MQENGQVREQKRSLEDIAVMLGGSVVGDSDTLITNAADIREAQAGDIVFAESGKFLQAALRSSASAVLTRSELAEAGTSSAKPLILVANPRTAFVQLLQALAQPWEIAFGVHASALIAHDVKLGLETRIGPHVSVEAGAIIGDRVMLMAGVRVGKNCIIGDDSVLYPNVVLYPSVRVGRRCLLHAGCVLGADGFGYAQVGHGLLKVPHLGRVELGDDVEVGANTCIDRAKTGVTVIGSGTKLDNLVHIAHNVQVGMSSLIIAQTGIAGSVTIGNGVILAGQSGIKDHVKIGDGARVGAQGGVIGNVEPGQTVSGYPARPHSVKMREYAAAAALPDYIKRIRELEKKLEQLEARIERP